MTPVTVVFSWIDGTTPFYDNWAPDEPNSMNNEEDCVEVSMELNDKGSWNDISCSHGFGYVCKYAKGECETSSTITEICFAN